MQSLSCFCPAVISFLLYQLSGAGSTHWNWNSGTKKNEGMRLPVNISPRWNMELNFILVITKHDDQRVSGSSAAFLYIQKKPLNAERSTFTHWIEGTQLFPPKMKLFSSFKCSNLPSENQTIFELEIEIWILAPQYKARKKKKRVYLDIFAQNEAHLDETSQKKQKKSINTNQHYINEGHHSTGYTALSLGGLHSNSCLPYYNNQRYLIICLEWK